ncbi:MAG: PEGA domain-containing protein [Methanoregula sp.]|nr:PEGA domain-containing protein [Methanoregula sp.]
MSRGSGSSLIPFAVFFAILLIVLPVSAYNVAMYGTSAGFDPALHTGTVNVVKAVPGSAGIDLDTNIDQFVDPSVDVIILGGEATFSPSTAAKIEAAVAGGKVLVVTYPCNQLFDTSLPASNGGTTTGGQYLEISDPNSAVSKIIFATLPTKYDLMGTAPEKEQAVAHPGTMTVLNFDTGMPALLYGKYGKGYVIQWTTVPVPSYMDYTTADMVIHRMILGLLPEPAATQTTVATPRTTAVVPKTTVVITQPVITAASPVQTPGSTGATGEVMVYSSPTGARIWIDGVDCGTTPGKVGLIPAGNHILRMTLDGYYDYEGSIYVVPGQTTQGYGTLQPKNQITAAPTTAPTPVPTVIVPIIIATPTPSPTQDPGLLGNSSIVVALIGVITAIIAAGASIFTHVKPPKKE